MNHHRRTDRDLVVNVADTVVAHPNAAVGNWRADMVGAFAVGAGFIPTDHGVEAVTQVASAVGAGG